MLLRDAFMAREVEEQILRRGERGLVWVGAAHSSIHCRNPGPAHSGWGRMGYMLRQKHGAQIFQIRVHDADVPVSMSDPAYQGPAPAMSSWLERVMSRLDHAPTGFDTAGSPFEPLRDGGSWDYAFDPDLRFGDVAAGYLYLAPARALNPCEWLAGYVSEEMFVADKPFYVALGRRASKEVRSAVDADGPWITR